MFPIVPFLPGYRWHRVARGWRTPVLGELLMGFTTRWGLRRELPRELADAAWETLRPRDPAGDPAALPLGAARRPGPRRRAARRRPRARADPVVHATIRICPTSSRSGTPTRSAGMPRSSSSRAATGPGTTGRTWSSGRASSSAPKEFLRDLKLGICLSRQGVVRHLLSKSIAGGLSAAVVLLWWPVFFQDVNSVSSWLVRGVAWTVWFEVLAYRAHAIRARALGDLARRASRGPRRTRRSRGFTPAPHRRRISRLSAVASMAMAVPVALLVTGLQKQPDARAQGPVVRPIKVVRVTKVVKVEKVVPAGQARAPVQRPVEAAGSRSPDSASLSLRAARRAVRRLSAAFLSSHDARGKVRRHRHGPPDGRLRLRAGTGASIRGRPLRSSSRCCSRSPT